MLIPQLIQHPQMLTAILRNTPTYVWILLAALIWLGLSQVRKREVGMMRVGLTPVVMTGLAVWSMTSAFAASPMFGTTLVLWIVAAAIAFAAIAAMPPPRGAEYHAATRTFFLPGSWTPLALIMGVFLTRYVVNVDLAMQPALAHDGPYTLIVAAVYGVCSGIFAGRAARLWRLAAPHAGFGFLLQRDPW